LYCTLLYTGRRFVGSSPSSSSLYSTLLYTGRFVGSSPSSSSYLLDTSVHGSEVCPLSPSYLLDTSVHGSEVCWLESVVSVVVFYTAVHGSKVCPLSPSYLLDSSVHGSKVCWLESIVVVVFTRHFYTRLGGLLSVCITNHAIARFSGLVTKGGKNKPQIWNPQPGFAYSLYNFCTGIMTIKGKSRFGQNFNGFCNDIES